MARPGAGKSDTEGFGAMHRGRKKEPDRPIITLLTDFGLRDGYVASMKGVILERAPDARLVDISHLVAPRDVRSAAFVLFTAHGCFPAGTVHLAVVDPGVGTSRRAIAVRTRSFFFVGPDNGIFSLVLKAEKGWEARSLENPEFHRKPLSSTFHGRDLFAPAAARIARGAPFHLFGPVCDPLLSEWSAPAHTAAGIEGEVIHIDHFGNCITNVTRKELETSAPADRYAVRLGAVVLPHILDTYGQVETGKALALVGSSGFIEIAVNGGSAEVQLGLRAGTKVLFPRTGA